MFNSGDVILANVQFTDTFEMKTRPALMLFEDLGNIVIAGITSNLDMKGIPISREEGAIKDSIIKTNYIFTISEFMVKKKLFTLNKKKKEQVYLDILNKLSPLRN